MVTERSDLSERPINQIWTKYKPYCVRLVDDVAMWGDGHGFANFCKI